MSLYSGIKFSSAEGSSSAKIAKDAGGTGAPTGNSTPAAASKSTAPLASAGFSSSLKFAPRLNKPKPAAARTGGTTFNAGVLEKQAALHGSKPAGEGSASLGPPLAGNGAGDGRGDVQVQVGPDGKAIASAPSMTIAPVQRIKRDREEERKRQKKKKKRKQREQLMANFNPDEPYDPSRPNDLVEYQQYRKRLRAERRAKYLEEKRRREAGESSGSSYYTDSEDEAPRRDAPKMFAPPSSYGAPPSSSTAPTRETLQARPPSPPRVAGPVPSVPVSAKAQASSGEDAYARRQALSMAQSGDDAYARRLALSQGQSQAATPAPVNAPIQSVPGPPPSTAPQSAAGAAPPSPFPPTSMPPFPPAAPTPPAALPPFPPQAPPTTLPPFAPQAPPVLPPFAPAQAPPFPPFASAGPPPTLPPFAPSTGTGSATLPPFPPSDSPAMPPYQAAVNSYAPLASASPAFPPAVAQAGPTDSTNPAESADFTAALEERKRAAAAIAAKFNNLKPALPKMQDLTGTFAEKLMKKWGHVEGTGIGARGDGLVHALSTEHVAKPTDPNKILSKRQLVKQRVAAANAKKRKWVQAPSARGRIVDANAEARAQEEREKVGDASRIVCLIGMVESEDDVDEEMPEEIGEECSKFGIVERVVLHMVEPPPVEPSECLRVFVVFSGMAGAWRAIKEMDGRFFGGRKIKAAYFPEDRFESGDRDGPLF